MERERKKREGERLKKEKRKGTHQGKAGGRPAAFLSGCCHPSSCSQTKPTCERVW